MMIMVCDEYGGRFESDVDCMKMGMKSSFRVYLRKRYIVLPLARYNTEIKCKYISITPQNRIERKIIGATLNTPVLRGHPED